jgi:AP2-associated kinase
LSEGGFAHVYVVQLPRPVEGNDKAVLKRVAVPDKEHLANMRTEVDTMKRLRGQRQIVKYIDSHASQLKGGGYEVFLLMEYCQGGGLIDFMNTRLQNRLTEPEILKIFTDIAEGVANMHYLKPPLLHRDLKVENVLISTSGSKKIFKLCDFGSAAPPRPPATTAAEARMIEDDVQRHTTLQYRSPEMIDVYRKLPIDEKSDIWALGVFLYKLCYYTTPFEEVGQMAILNAKFKYPGYPRFSDQLKLLIASMLREKPGDRPNIYQVLQKACQLDGRDLPVRDIYAHRSQSESRKDQVLPASPSSSQSRVGASLTPAAAEPTKASIPEIAPMRRGRPTKPVSHHGSAKPSPSPLRMVDGSDPFAALDGGKTSRGDELSSKFPTLDEFSLMTDRGKKFSFEPQQGTPQETADPGLAQRVTNALADQAFGREPSPAKAPAKSLTEKPPIAAKPHLSIERDQFMERRDNKEKSMLPKSNMISTGTSASPPPIAKKLTRDPPVWKVPSHDGVTRPSGADKPFPKAAPPEPSEKKSRLARLLQDDAANSQGSSEHEPRSPTSSRPSLEGGRPSLKEVDMGLTRSRSLNMQPRPASVNIGKGLTHIKDKEIKHITTRDYETNFVSAEPETAEEAIESDMNIHSDVDFLKAREEEERERKQHHRMSSGSRHGKRSSLPHIALSGTKNLLTGRFGDAFKKFEGGHGHERSQSRGSMSDHDKHEPLLSQDRRDILTPIAGSEATDLSDDRRLEDPEEMSPAMRRDLEKRQLEAEERRVEQAAAEYRKQVAARGGGGGGGGMNRAATIQNKVQSLLSETNKPSQKTAAGYGRFTQDPAPRREPEPQRPSVPIKPEAMEHKPLSAQVSARNLVQRPAAPPKPKVLSTGQGNAGATITASSPGQTELVSPDDWEDKFNKRFPSLSGIEMVETDIDKKGPSSRIREI